MRFLILICFPILSFAQSPSEIYLKNLYYNAIENEDSTELLLEKSEEISKESPSILIGYKAMANLLSAKFAWFPTSKLEYFNEGKKWLEAAIKKAPENVELIFFRFSTQMESPSILNYKQNTQNDRLFLILNFNSVKDEKVKGIIKTYLLDRGECTEAQKKLVQG